jgi:two-component system, sensor histidine kinase PdtaS
MLRDCAWQRSFELGGNPICVLAVERPVLQDGHNRTCGTARSNPRQIRSACADSAERRRHCFANPMNWTLKTIVEGTAFTRAFPVWARYIATTFIVLLAFAVHLAFRITLGENYFVFFFPAIVLSAVLFDRGNGIWATLLGAGFVSYAFFPKGLADTEHVLFLLIFIGAGIATAAVMEVMHVVIEKLGTALRELTATNERLAGSNQQNAILLDELRHRTKNELQLIHAILHMQGRSIASPEQAQEALVSAANRVMVLGRAHERFSLQGRKSIIDLCQFVEDLCNDLRVSVLGPQSILVSNEMEHCYLGMEKALPVGLILNELVTNAIKYAFPENRPGNIRVKLFRQAQQLCVCVADDGIGPSPTQGSGKGSGQRLVRALTSQINGTLEITQGPNGGTQCMVCFPAPEELAATTL